MDTNLILIILVIISLVTVVFLLVRGDRDRSRLNQQLIEFSEMSQRLAQEQTQKSHVSRKRKAVEGNGFHKIRTRCS